MIMMIFSLSQIKDKLGKKGSSYYTRVLKLKMNIDYFIYCFFVCINPYSCCLHIKCPYSCPTLFTHILIPFLFLARLSTTPDSF